MHLFVDVIHDNLCGSCNKPEKDEIHYTEQDIRDAEYYYQLYRGEQQAGLIPEPDDEEIKDYDIDFIHDEVRNK